MALNLLVSLFGRLVACSGRISGTRQTDGRNDRPSTITLAAHARRGLIKHQAHIKHMYPLWNTWAVTVINSQNLISDNLQGIPKGKWVCPWQTPWKVLRSVYITDNNTQKKVLLSYITDNNTFF